MQYFNPILIYTKHGASVYMVYGQYVGLTDMQVLGICLSLISVVYFVAFSAGYQAL